MLFISKYMKTKIFALIPVALLILNACKKNETTEEKSATKAIPQAQLVAKIGMFQDSAKATWKVMMQADDQKIAFVKRLLEEISYMPKYDIVKHAKLMEKCKNLYTKRFDEKSFMQSGNIDLYDAATDSLLKELKTFVISSPNVENYPLCSELLNDITALDNDVIMHRVKYDGWAKQYNALLDDQKEVLAKMGPEYANLKKMGLFQLEL